MQKKKPMKCVKYNQWNPLNAVHEIHEVHFMVCVKYRAKSQAAAEEEEEHHLRNFMDLSAYARGQ